MNLTLSTDTRPDDTGPDSRSAVALIANPASPERLDAASLELLMLAAVPSVADPGTAEDHGTADDRVAETDDAPGLSSYARCADGNGTLSFLFFSEDDLELARAKAICRSCGLQETCLSGAIEREEPYGVWGGKLVLDGVPVEFKRKRGRPPKNPKPILEVDEAPIPPHLVA